MWLCVLSALIFLDTQFVYGYFNILIKQNEMKKLMGLDAELYYVKEGNVNYYAMQFVVPVPPNIEDLEFAWESFDHPLPYLLTIEYESHKGALLAPQLTIPARGFLPLTLETFAVHLPCAGNVSEEVPIAINLKVRNPYGGIHNETNLHFKRNKICMRGPVKKKTPPPVQAAPESSSAVFSAMACAVGLLLVVGLLVSAMYVRTKKQLRRDSLNNSYTAHYGSHQNVLLRLDPVGRPPSVNSGSYATIASLNKYPLYETKRSWFRTTRSASPSPYATALLPFASNNQYNNNNEIVYDKPESVCQSRASHYASSQLTQVYSLSTPARSFHSNGSNPKDKLRRIGVAPSTIICQHLIQEGTYGRIYTGILHHPLGETRDVLIKTVVDGTSLSQVGYLLAEASLLCGVSHPHLLFPTAAYTELPGPPQIAYPLPAKGNLKILLQNSKDGIQTSATTLGTRQLVEFGLQVAKGITHLHSLGVLHKDIATRNCVVDFNNNVRVCDTALSRDLFPNDYHCLGDNENRPIKWMAIETLEKKFHTTASDVWSLGVLLWELATLAAMPFEEVDSFELGAYLRDGYRLAQPINCPDEFYTVMSCCWLADFKQRPAFPQLVAFLTDFHEDLSKYI